MSKFENVKRKISGCLGGVKGKVAAVATGVAVSTGSAMAAQTPQMEAIEFPIDLGSVASVVAVAGGTMLLAWAGIKIGFSLAKRLIQRVGAAV